MTVEVVSRCGDNDGGCLWLEMEVVMVQNGGGDDGWRWGTIDGWRSRWY